MKTRLPGSLLWGISFVVLTILSCTSPMQLFATPTPTSTSTYTPTITSTPTATPVPPPPFVITSCVFQEDCPEATLVGDYLPSDAEYNVVTPVEFNYEDNVRLNIGWCTKDETALEQNVEHISYIFEIDGISYLDYATVKNGYYWGDDPSNPLPCTFIGAMLSGFQIGGVHQVRIGYSFDEPVFDGWKTNDPFTSAYIFELRPAFVPTATPTITPWPTAEEVYNTPVPPCDVSSSIDISNTTGSTVTLILTGPGYFEFYLAPDDTNIKVCPGTYDYEAYGCGGASDYGTMSSGEAHEFYCSG